MGASVHVCPLDRTEDLHQLLADIGVADHVVVFRGEVAAAGLSDTDLAQALTGDLEALQPAWAEFLRQFAPLADELDGAHAVDPETAFLVRTLLVHRYRRVVLREPELPAELWPAGWIGERSYACAAACYAALVAPAEDHLTAVGAAGGSPLPAPDRRYADRYSPRAALLT